MTTNAFSILLFVMNNIREKNFLNLRHPVTLNSLITHVIGEGALKSQVLENASMGNTSRPRPTSPQGWKMHVTTGASCINLFQVKLRNQQLDLCHYNYAHCLYHEDAESGISVSRK